MTVLYQPKRLVCFTGEWSGCWRECVWCLFVVDGVFFNCEGEEMLHWSLEDQPAVTETFLRLLFKYHEINPINPVSIQSHWLNIFGVIIWCLCYIIDAFVWIGLAEFSGFHLVGILVKILSWNTHPLVSPNLCTFLCLIEDKERNLEYYHFEKFKW